eukprot:CAMPEP_0172815138 /NCGR_PEP_ID=MMETSP1075-20121228/11602_1 /TAXON_ID=2916 /ORGANISM="Ceratium fusus, Strain PA161109" /LENGTH=568 /DNA_ID=CAMNT_0013654969 /DNA_START=25 /DNA_END=1728 /DNA_ORIENTATION=-
MNATHDDHLKPSSQTLQAEVVAPTEFVPRPLTEFERQAAWRQANFYCATPRRERPVALWILGPSSVGKSTLTAKLAGDLGIPPAAVEAQAEGGDQRCQLDAVLVDGEFMREAHGLWQRWVKTPDWRSAYPALKSLINKEKDAMCTEAALQRKHLVIPQTMLNLEKGLTEIEELTWSGYTNNVLAIVAPLEDCQRRGRRREVATGKRYEPREFEQSISAIVPMTERCNGRFKAVLAVEVNDSDSELSARHLQSGDCGACIGRNLFDSVALEAAIRQAVGSMSLSKPATLVPSRPTSAAESRQVLARLATADLTPRPLNDDERKVAWTAANFHRTTPQEQPVALWVLGPPFVGKSSLVAQLTDLKGTVSFLDCLFADSEGELNAVNVDGDVMRKVHGLWKSWLNTDDWQSADPALKSMLNKEKDRLCTAAATRRLNLVLGRRLLDLQKGLSEITELAYQGYTNHVLAVVAPEEDCSARSRSCQEGRVKRYEAADYEKSMAAIPRMIGACNGNYAIILAEKGHGDSSRLRFRSLRSGAGSSGVFEDKPASELADTTDYWRAILEDALLAAK